MSYMAILDKANKIKPGRLDVAYYFNFIKEEVRYSVKMPRGM